MGLKLRNVDNCGVHIRGVPTDERGRRDMHCVFSLSVVDVTKALGVHGFRERTNHSSAQIEARSGDGCAGVVEVGEGKGEGKGEGTEEDTMASTALQSCG